jgi:hydroxyacyl-ACP dehydratase HTD2-like protein with hotdog domain
VPIDRRYIGFRLPAFTVQVSAQSVRRFAEAIGLLGEQDYSVAPPTYMKVIEGEGNSSRAIVSALQIDLRRVLHIEQEFEYEAPIRMDDCVTVERTVRDIYAKRNGVLEFVVIDSKMHNSNGVSLGRSRQTILVRNVPSAAPSS